MKQLLFILLLLPMSLPAQEVRSNAAAETAVSVPFHFGYLSYKAVFKQMPDYQEARKNFEALKAKYDAEAIRAEKDFQHKFTEYIEGQKEFPHSILLKRQSELQDLMEKGINFRKESVKLLEKAEKDLQQPVAERLNQAISSVATEHKLLFVLNTDGDTCPFIHPQAGIDITAAVLTHLGLMKNEQ